MKICQTNGFRKLGCAAGRNITCATSVQHQLVWICLDMSWSQATAILCFSRPVAHRWLLVVLGDWATEGPISCWKTVAMQGNGRRRIFSASQRSVKRKAGPQARCTQFRRKTVKRSPQQIREYPVYPVYTRYSPHQTLLSSKLIRWATCCIAQGGWHLITMRCRGFAWTLANFPRNPPILFPTKKGCNPCAHCCKCT